MRGTRAADVQTVLSGYTAHASTGETRSSTLTPARPITCRSSSLTRDPLFGAVSAAVKMKVEYRKGTVELGVSPDTTVADLKKALQAKSACACVTHWALGR